MRLLALVAVAFLPALAAAQPGVNPNRPTEGPWPDSLVGGVAPPAEVQALYAIAAAVDADRIEADIRRLAGFGTRHTLSDTVSDTRGIGAARRWIHAEFERISQACGGCLEVVYQRRTIAGERRIPEPTDVVNVLAIQRGTADPNRYVVMSGDIDSRVSDPLDAHVERAGSVGQDVYPVRARRAHTASIHHPTRSPTPLASPHLPRPTPRHPERAERVEGSLGRRGFLSWSESFGRGGAVGRDPSTPGCALRSG